MPRTQLLIIEDAPILADDLSTLLTQLDYVVIGVVSSLHAAMRAIANQRPDLVLMGIAPHATKDKIEGAQLIQEQGAIPVIFVAEAADQTFLERARGIHVYGHVFKPFRINELQSNIEMALCRWQADQRLHQALEISVQRESEVAALLKSSHAILEYQAFENAARTIFDTACDLIGATSGYVALLTPDGAENEVLFLESGGLPFTVNPSLPMPLRGLCAEAYHSGQSVYDNRFADSDWMDFMPDGHADLKNVMFAPVNLDGKTVGLVGLANKPGNFTDHDAAMASAFGDMAAIALRNSRTLEKLAESEQTSRALIEAPTNSVFLIATDSTILDLNEIAASKLGKTRDQMFNQRMFDFYLPPVAERRQTRLEEALSTGKPVRFEDEHAGIWFDTIVYPVRAVHSEITRLAVISRDISDRKQHEINLSESARRLNEHVEELNCLYGVSRLIERDGLSLSHIIEGTVNLIQAAWQYPALTGVRIQLERPPQEAQTANFELTQWAQTCDITIHGQAVGRIEVCYLEDVPLWNSSLVFDREQKLLAAVAERLGKTIERIEVGMALEQRIVQMTLINQIAGQVTSELDLDSLLEQAATLIHERFGYQHVGLFMLNSTGTALVLRAKAGEYSERFPANHSLALGQGMVGNAAELRQTLLANDVTSDQQFVNPFEPEQVIGAELSVPIKIFDAVVGVLDIQSRWADTFGQTDIIVMETLAKQLTAAIQNARLYDQVQQYAKDLEKQVDERTKQLSVAYEDLKDLAHAKDEFLTRVSHELRTPLTTIMVRHHLLAKHHPELQERYLASLDREAKRLHYIVEELIYVSRMQQTQIELNPESVNLSELVNLYVFDRLPRAEERNLSLTFAELAEIPPLWVDRMLIERVLGILLDNAFNYTPEGGRIEVSIRTRSEDGLQRAGIQVKDNGYGIHPNEQPRIFERFYRGRIVREKLTTTPGAGLGLAIAKEIIDWHDGRIEVVSEGQPGKGTAFIIWLPLQG